MKDYIINDANVPSKKGHLHYFNKGDDWLKKEFRDPDHVIDHILPQGTALFFGEPKIGKSWVCLGWCKQLALLGETSLYYSFEDPEHRLNNRLQKSGCLEPSVRNYIYSCAGVSAGLTEVNERFAENLKLTIEEVKPRLVIIDTLSHVKSLGREDYVKVQKWCKMFSPIAHDNSCAIVFVHHDRKSTGTNQFMDAHGSIAYTGSMDTLLSVKRAGSNTKDIMLSVTGKDIAISRPVRLTWNEDTCLFSMDDNSLTSELGSTQKAVLTIMRMWCDLEYNLDIRQNYQLMGICEYPNRISQSELLTLMNTIVNQTMNGEPCGGEILSQLGLPFRKSKFTKQEISRAIGKLHIKGFVKHCTSEGNTKYYAQNDHALHLSYNDKSEF